jgi:hypothetical protein
VPAAVAFTLYVFGAFTIPGGALSCVAGAFLLGIVPWLLVSALLFFARSVVKSRQQS